MSDVPDEPTPDRYADVLEASDVLRKARFAERCAAENAARSLDHYSTANEELKAASARVEKATGDMRRAMALYAKPEAVIDLPVSWSDGPHE